MTDSFVRLGVDIGGTFTDVVLESDGEFFSSKVLTTYCAPENAIIDGLHKVCQLADVAPQQISQIIHGTTLATNALIERSGAKTALITTQGFRDVIEMRTESRFEQYDLNLQLPEPLLPRYQRYTVDERIAADGQVLQALQVKEVETLAQQLKQAAYQSIAVGLLHSYANDAHERLIKEVLAEHLPGVMVSLSSQVSPQMREYERFNTVVANAYVQPMMKSYLDRLKDQLVAEGVSGDVFLMHSGGGIMSLADAAQFPVRLVESGPAGGAVFAATLAARYELDNVLSFDMGGTTAKICLIKQQTPKTSRVFEVARSYRFKKGSGMPISIPAIDMVEIGAGGGSLARVDSMQQIRVGPESAGSEPGPASYGQGGTRPAVSDADLVLGKLDANNFAGGSIVLNKQAAEQALVGELGSTFNMDTQTAAFAVNEVVDENMANAARMHAVENGEDLSGYTLIAFGGAAPLHANRLAEKLGIQRLLIPKGAGVGSAIGFLRAPFGFEANRSVYMRLSDFDAQAIQTLFRELQTQAEEFVRSCDATAQILFEHKVYMRYQGQGWEIPVPLTHRQAMQPDCADYQARFMQEYKNLFGRTVDGMQIEITIWSVNATTPVRAETKICRIEAGRAADTSGTRPVFDAASRCMVEAAIIDRDALNDGEYLFGPAVICEAETSIVINNGSTARQQSDGCIEILLS